VPSTVDAGRDKILEVLLIDGDPRAILLVEIAMAEAARDSRTRVRISWTRTLADGIAELERSGPDLDAIILDLGLPDGAGLVGLRAVRNLNNRVPIVAVDSGSDIDAATAALKHGASDYLDKSEIQPRTLMRAIRYAIERKKSEAELIRLAQTDPLTGLLNRRAFFERLEDALVQARRSQLACAVVVFDIDGFKEINDLFGHKTGDDLLVAIARNLRSNLRESDSIGRLGGDEFAVIAPNLRSANDAMEIADKVAYSVQMIDELNDIRIEPKISVGISVFPMDDSDVEALVSHADMAMYKSKGNKKGSINFYDARMDAAVKDRHALKHRIRSDINDGKFFLLYQPIISADTGRIIGAEGLARWRDTDGSVLTPDRFIPLAEESGAITSLGGRLLEEACGFIRISAEAQKPVIPISLNISTIQCRDPGFGLRLIAAIENFQIPPTVINIEVTESTIIQNMEVTRNNLRVMKQYGIGIHMDDFGTGYSSLSLLRILPIDAVKIDKSFIDDLGKSGGSDAIVEAVVMLSKKLGFATIAEGVETDVQVARLSDFGVDALQGFYFSKPISAEDLIARLESEDAAEIAASSVMVA
jgi:diguanylate cyclase (GGDEF)-like protein